MAVSGMNHFTILTDDVERSVRFYDDFLGLKAGSRPHLNFHGAWLYAGDRPILHIIGDRSKSCVPAHATSSRGSLVAGRPSPATS